MSQKNRKKMKKQKVRRRDWHTKHHVLRFQPASLFFKVTVHLKENAHYATLSKAGAILSGELEM